MTDFSMPGVKPVRPSFSSGPCVKRPGYDVARLAHDCLGRSHRSTIGKARLKEAIAATRDVLGVPDSYRIGIVPGSDTGAVEMAMWNMLGARKVTMLAWESFGQDWVTDVIQQLKLDAQTLTASYGKLPDLAKVDCDTDVVFTWNGTTSGVRVPDASWISPDRQGLTICDATSAVFAQELDWAKLDVVTFSWQKVLGGEGAHGMLILGPRAVARLEQYTPDRPLPKIFRLTKGGKLIEGIFSGATINTPSMLCVEDYLDALDWARNIGGAQGMIAKANANLAVMEDWVARSSWITFLAQTPAIRSNSSVCFKIVDPAIAALDEAAQNRFVKSMTTLLEEQEAAFDIGAYRDAPPGLRVWCGATVEAADLKILTAWLDYAFWTSKAAL